MSTNGWNSKVEKLLNNWSKQIDINEAQYRERGAYFRKMYYIFGIVDIFLETGALVTLINVLINISKVDTKPVGVLYISLLGIVLGLETTVFTIHAFEKFFNFGGVSEQFYESAKDYDALRRLINMTLTLPRRDRDKARGVILSIKEQFNIIQRTSPNVPPHKVVKELDMNIYDNPEEAKGERSTSSGTTVHYSEENDEPLQVPIGQQCKFNEQMKFHRDAVNRDYEQNKILGGLEYQWRRFEQHDDEEKKIEQ